MDASVNRHRNAYDLGYASLTVAASCDVKDAKAESCLAPQELEMGRFRNALLVRFPTFL